MHRVAHPQHRPEVAGVPQALNERRERGSDTLRAHPRDEHDLALLRARVQRPHKLRDFPHRRLRPDLDPHGVANPAQILHVRPAHLARPLAQPGQVRGEVVPPAPPRHRPRLRALVEQVQGLVAGEELDPRELIDAGLADGLHELQPLGEPLGHPLILAPKLVGKPGVPHEAQIPVLRMVDVREPALHERADEVQRHRRVRVALHHPPRVRAPGLGRELRSIHKVAVVRRQRHAGAVDHAGLGRTGPRLGVLPGDAADPRHRLHPRVDQHHRHLQENLELARDRLRAAVRDLLGAVAPLQDEPATLLGLGDLGLQPLDLPACDQRGQRPQLRRRRLDLGAVGVHHLLGVELGAPRLHRPAGSGAIDRGR